MPSWKRVNCIRGKVPAVSPADGGGAMTRVLFASSCTKEYEERVELEYDIFTIT
jgi:hypothetical protein